METATSHDGTDLPHLDHALPLWSEASWSNLLAALIDTDHLPLCQVLDLDAPDKLTVRREVDVGRGGRIDLVVESEREVLAVIEVKVLSGLGHRQLHRYEEALPGASHYAVVHPESLAMDVTATPNWRAISWESLLDEHARSTNSWVAATAGAWRAHLERALPRVDGSTVWNHLEPGEGFVVQMRARFSWLHSAVVAPPAVYPRLGWSSAGVSSTFSLRRSTVVEGYTAIAEVEERLPVRNYPKLAGHGVALIGPSLWVGLMLSDIATSADFDWSYLHKVWIEAMADSRTDWVLNSPRPKAHDKDAYDAMVAAGGPRHLGVGFGARQVRISQACMFGARAQLSPTMTLQHVADDLTSMAPVVEAMAAVEP